MKSLLYITAFLACLPSFSQITSYRLNQTPHFDEVISTYEMFDNKYEEAKLIEYGKSDNGKPIYLFVINPQKVFTAEDIQKHNALVILINNGIHPGEPDGINASIELTSDILSKRIRIPPNVVVAIIPVYNIDGALNRGCCSRANQNGPQEYGFRANATNLDLNRDFIKTESENTRTFIKIFREWKPDIFIDTHVSNGADYQHVMTLIESQKDKMDRITGNYMHSDLTPKLYKAMEASGYPMCPYVNVWDGTPDRGYEGFLESPRFATGYAALYNTISYVTESHMLKPFPQRVEATYAFLNNAIGLAGSEYAKIKEVRRLARKITLEQKTFPLQWVADTVLHDTILFRGYEGKYIKSNVTGLDRLYYDRTKPFEKYIKHYNNFHGIKEVQKPIAYIIPQAWKTVIERMLLNDVAMSRLVKDTVMNVSCYYIRDYKSSATPYEGKHVKSNVEVEKIAQQVQFLKGDYVIECNQESNRYIIETLEPQATDSWFAWGFFDAILQQKEWFSDYIFIDDAEKMLAGNAGLKEEFEKKKKEEPSFAQNKWAMLTWLYHRSPNYEKTHNRLPVFRLEK